MSTVVAYNLHNDARQLRATAAATDNKCRVRSRDRLDGTETVPATDGSEIVMRH